LLLTPYF